MWYYVCLLMLMSNNKLLVYLLDFNCYNLIQLLEREEHLPLTQQGTEINVLLPVLLVAFVFHAQEVVELTSDASVSPAFEMLFM